MASDLPTRDECLREAYNLLGYGSADAAAGSLAWTAFAMALDTPKPAHPDDEACALSRFGREILADALDAIAGGTLDGSTYANLRGLSGGHEPYDWLRTQAAGLRARSEVK